MAEMIEQNLDNEVQVAPEIPRGEWKGLMFMQRHGPYNSKAPQERGNPTEEEQKTLGRLTPEGVAVTHNISRDRVEAMLEQDPEHIDFLFVNSPTYWHDDERLGQRARETAEIAVEETEKALAEKGLPKTQILNFQKRKLKEGDEGYRFKGEVSRPEVRLQEAQFFQVPVFAQFMRSQHGGKQGPDFWKAYNRDTYRQQRYDMGVHYMPVIESSEDRVNEMKQFIDAVARYMKVYTHAHPDRKLVVWMVTHGDGLEPFAQRGIGIPEKDFSAGYNDGFGIVMNQDGQFKAMVKGKDYDVSVTSHGKSEKIEPKIYEEMRLEEAVEDIEGVAAKILEGKSEVNLVDGEKELKIRRSNKEGGPSLIIESKDQGWEDFKFYPGSRIEYAKMEQIGTNSSEEKYSPRQVQLVSVESLDNLLVRLQEKVPQESK